MTDSSGPIWVDGPGFSRTRLLGGGAVPWAQPGELASYLSRSAALLGTDALLVDLGEVWGSRLSDPATLEAMAARTRRGRALRTLLEDDTALHLVAEVVRTSLAASGRPTVAVVPSPARWVRSVSTAVGAPDQLPDQDTVDAASMYVAGALNAVDLTGVSALMIDEGLAGSAELAPPYSYEPVLNVAQHLRIPVAIRSSRTACWPSGDVPGIWCWFGGDVPDAPVGLWAVVGDVSSTLAPAADGAPRFVAVPDSTDPDALAETVRTWRVDAAS